MTVQHTRPDDAGTHLPIPGADPNGYMLGQFGGSNTWFEGALLTFKAKSADTRNALSFFQCDVPYGWQAPVHAHERQNELFHITEGEIEILVNDTVHKATPGCTLWIPADTNHSLFVTSPRARGFCVITPGDGFEEFFEDLGEPAKVASMPTQATWTPSVDELAEAGAKYGWRLVDPAPRRLS